MQTFFNWVRDCRSGAELIAVLRLIHQIPDLFQKLGKIGPPFLLTHTPCQRCYFHPREDHTKARHCKACQSILTLARHLGNLSNASVVVWGFVNYIPSQIDPDVLLDRKHFYGVYIHDDHHFLVVMHRKRLMEWIREILIYQGDDIKGFIQILQTTGNSKRGTMGDILCRAVHHENRFPMDLMRIRFYPKAYQIFKPIQREKDGVLTFEISEFLNLMEMAAIFKSLLNPESQKNLLQLTQLQNEKEQRFYWGRFMGFLSDEGKDMLNSWNIRQWPSARVKLLYDLLAYVHYSD